MSTKLYSGDRFPAMELKLAGGGRFALPDAIGSKYLILAFYRGHW